MVGLVEQTAALFAGAGAEVDQPVGAAHHLLVVLDHHHGIAFVAQGLQRVDELAVVFLVQADARFVEYIEHVDQF